MSEYLDNKLHAAEAARDSYRMELEQSRGAHRAAEIELAHKISENARLLDQLVEIRDVYDELSLDVDMWREEARLRGLYLEEARDEISEIMGDLGRAVADRQWWQQRAEALQLANTSQDAVICNLANQRVQSDRVIEELRAELRAVRGVIDDPSTMPNGQKIVTIQRLVDALADATWDGHVD